MENVATARGVEAQCLFSSDIDTDAQLTYQANFGELPAGDICKISADAIPNHDLLLGGFPCQPFSIIGSRLGFEDTRGTLFFEIARLIDAKRPRAFLLENVKQLVGHDSGRTLQRILQVLQVRLGYQTCYKVLNALDFGLPQKRERVFIAGFREATPFTWPRGGTIPPRPLEEILEPEVPESYWATETIRANRLAQRDKVKTHRTIWHENKGGHISAYPYSCALRAGASYNYLLVDGERRLTPREMLRLQGFPESFKIIRNYSAMRKLTGNSVAIPVVQAVLTKVLEALDETEPPMIQTNFLTIGNKFLS
ncbi:MAG: DNA (cytosine-5-)-methyltransferase [Chloroflexi bacterium]|nr:DNA (cytosine-5-)-methyltransferase [Chloroflexota bacterium]